MSYIGIDYGEKRVGIAVSDEHGTMAFPAEVVPAKEALEKVLALARSREATGIVIGESKDFHGADNKIMEHIRSFAAALQERAGESLNIYFHPEFLTSAEASRGSDDEHLDASAAALILQSFLDSGKGVQ